MPGLSTRDIDEWRAQRHRLHACLLYVATSSNAALTTAHDLALAPPATAHEGDAPLLQIPHTVHIEKTALSLGMVVLAVRVQWPRQKSWGESQSAATALRRLSKAASWPAPQP